MNIFQSKSINIIMQQIISSYLLQLLLEQYYDSLTIFLLLIITLYSINSFMFLISVFTMVSPRELKAVVGKNVKFKCMITKTAKWTFNNSQSLPNNAETMETDDYSINEDKNVFKYLLLKMINVREDNSGRYNCKAVVQVYLDIRGIK